MAVQPHRVSRQEGEGAGAPIDDLYDGEEYQAKDKRAETRTTFYERDIDHHVSDPRQRRQLKRALKLHEGQHANGGSSKSRGTQNHEEDQRRIIATLASQLELTRRQKQRVGHLVMDVMSVNSFGIYSTEQVTLATINVVAREDERWIEDEQQFRDFMRDVDMTADNSRPDMETLKRLRGLVKERIPSKQ